METKLSDTQKDIIKKMRNGWELGSSEGAISHTWIQQGGLGRGGKTQTVSFTSLRSLLKKGLIKAGKWDFPTRKYYLTHSGRTVKL